MAITTPHIAEIEIGITYARKFRWNPAATNAWTDEVIVYRLKKAKLVNGERADFVLRSDEAATDDGSQVVITNATERRFAVTIADEDSETFAPIENTKWTVVREDADGSKTLMWKGKARITNG